MEITDPAFVEQGRDCRHREPRVQFMARFGDGGYDVGLGDRLRRRWRDDERARQRAPSGYKRHV
jgi:hypothetical protein